ncbi:MAG TPA: DUF4350 domain-containing protein [Steroidobacteraceae bacterium]
MNRDRWIQAIVALGLLALIVWVARHTYWDEVTITTPPTGAAARNPYYALTRLAGSLGIQTNMIGSLRALPPDGIVFVNSLYDDLRHEPLESLQAWVQSGGRLIIRGNTLEASEPLQIWSGIRPPLREFESARPAAPGAPRTPVRPQAPGAPRTPVRPSAPRAVPRPVHDCRRMAVDIDGVADGHSLVLCEALPDGFTSERVPSWSLSDSQGIQALRVPIGRGELTVFGPFFMLTNQGLAKGDHAEIFIAAAGLKHGDRLEILSPTRAEPLPVLLWRLAAPALVFLFVAAALTIIRHLPRFGPPIPAAAPIRRSLAEQIRANARFAWRTQKLKSLRAAIRQALDEAAQRQIAGYALMGPRKRAEVLAASTGLDAATINAALVADSGGSVNEHRAAITLLDVCRRILIDSDPNKRPQR